MTDQRLTPSNGRVAANHLQGKVKADQYVAGDLNQTKLSITPLWRSADGQHKQRELLYGDGFTVLEKQGGFSFGQCEKDGYVGYVECSSLQESTPTTHFISNRGTHIYQSPDIKSTVLMPLSFGSRLESLGKSGEFLEIASGGFVPASHTRAAKDTFGDPVEVAELFLGTPYLWGGNSCWGIDCSGLVQVALLTCGFKSPGDSDMQEASVGAVLGNNSKIERGDLLFWEGHVAMAVDENIMIHANAHHMSVTHEPIDLAVERIFNSGGGNLTSRRRP
ncbi:MAG: NlpC/P60 family protein [Paracoccaceae bacterium]